MQTTEAVMPPNTTIPRRRSLYEDTQPDQPRSPKRRNVFLLPVCVGALLFIGLYVLTTQFIIPTWQNLTNQWNYGGARISQADAMGSHFIAQYWEGKIVVMQVSLANPNNYHTYVLQPLETPTVKNPVVELSFVDANHDGRLDIAIHVEGTNFELILYNTGNGFSERE